MSDQTAVTKPPRSRWGSKWLYLLGGILLGVSALLAIRFVTYDSKETHYHANFAVNINGEREQFRGQQYYQEVKVCALEGATPAARVHMHEQQNGLVHVHDEAVTWGQFFANLGWTVGPDFLRTNEALLTSDDNNRLHVVLNGQDLTDISSIANQVIDDRDRLLLSYGTPDQATLDGQYRSVPASAAEYNNKQDPASCSGAHHGGLKDRLRHLF